MDLTLRFVKTGRLLPALIWAEHDADADTSLVRLDLDMLTTDTTVLEKHRLERVSEARVPLAARVIGPVAHGEALEARDEVLERDGEAAGSDGVDAVRVVGRHHFVDFIGVECRTKREVAGGDALGHYDHVWLDAELIV